MAKISINLSDGSLENDSKELVIGIDLGTTNSLVAYVDRDGGQPIAVKDEEGTNKLVPSVIHFAADRAIVVGREAKQYLASDPARTIYSVKRLMGKSLKDVGEHADFFGYRIIDEDTDALVKIEVDQKYYTPIELSSLILKQLKKRVEKALGQAVSKAVITVPAYFNDAQRQATRDAGKIAGLEVLRIVNEPTAASLAYGIGLDPSDKKKIAVYDLGGGTFDVSILKIQQGIFEVLATNGDTYLGGDDFDRAIIDYWIERSGRDKASLLADKELGQRIRIMAEEAKQKLSTEQLVEGEIEGIDCQLTRTNFEALIKEPIDRTIAACQAALKDAGLGIGDIDEIIMVGGSTRVPAVKKAVSDFFQSELQDSVDPDQIVALGAAIQADILSGNQKDLLLLDVTPLSLGIETMGGLMDVIIPRNTKIPTKAARQYTTQVDGQASVRITVFQGERDQVKHNRQLGKFSLNGIPGMPAGLAKVEVSFLLDADGILQVKAKELRSGVEQSIQVKPQYGISDKDLATMLKDSIMHAEEDMSARALQEAVNEGEQIVLTTKKFINSNAELLSKEELEKTRELISQVEGKLQGSDKDALQAAIEKLNDFSRPFAERIMDIAISKAMKGKKI